MFSTMNEAQAVSTFSKLFKETIPKKKQKQKQINQPPQQKPNKNNQKENKQTKKESKREWVNHNMLLILRRVGNKYLKNCLLQRHFRQPLNNHLPF